MLSGSAYSEASYGDYIIGLGIDIIVLSRNRGLDADLGINIVVPSLDIQPMDISISIARENAKQLQRQCSPIEV